MASAVAAHEMRELSPAEARLLPCLGKLRAVVHIYPLLGGISYLAQLDEIFGYNRTHMVLDHNGTIIQPETKMQVPSGVVCDTDFWNALEKGNAPNGGTFLHGDFVFAFVILAPGVVPSCDRERFPSPCRCESHRIVWSPLGFCC
jgi:hypothetical protein